ncbi:5-formyltetrahydrofolate cyclo-ligase [Candidatus Rhodobacter oscarellae]|uniref:5-formyltetrahydrofolate cyclo-ligase n=1 Tax=Candidatus Rhodobacter oscarellae TaxID=1675527 RepID=A0A0J9E079_9RHOB|nr:5-formyltetrahydrofolate cyclo-ligase [Candidatus Rhodobacter lobularis]KMW56341.1 5-formyltetrahydrofolate cyclo-ligase [Candidatus Rhodobacter lobularis]
MMSKDAARKAAFARRKPAHGAGLDAAAQRHLRDCLSQHRGKPLAGYMPIRTEVDPVPVMADWDGPVGVPVIQGAGQPLLFHRWTQGCDMVEGPFGARVPAAQEPVVPQVLIVPLVAFDARGFRLGYGGGFYDRTLEGLRARGPVVAIGFAFAAQEAAELPLEPTDQPLDAMVTDAGVTWF